MPAENYLETRADDNPAFYLNLVARSLTRFFDRRLAALAVNVAYLPVLGALRATAPRSQRELAELGQIGQPAMAQMLDRMVKEGLVVRASDPADGRRILFALSDHAAGRMPAIRTVLMEGNGAVFDVLTDKERAEFLSSLHKIAARLKAVTEAAA